MTDKFDQLIDNLADSLAQDYEAARESAAAGDPQRAGHQGEATWVRLLRDWGPGWPVVTRKYIVGPGGTTNEVDVLVLKPDYPRHLRDETSILATGVAAAFSAKNTLRRKDVEEAFQQKRRILEVAQDRPSAPRRILQGPFPFGILAHRIDFGGSRTQQTDRLLDWQEKVFTPATHPSEELDLLLVAETCFLSNGRSTLAPRQDAWLPMSAMMRHPEHGAKGAPLAQFIFWLNRQCAPDNSSPALAGLGAKFGASEASGTMRWWDFDLYPEHIRNNPRVLLNDYGHPLTY